MEMPLTATKPPPVMFNVPLPEEPTVSVSLCQVEPEPSTVTTPVLPAKRPMSQEPLLTAPPPVTFSVPLPW